MGSSTKRSEDSGSGLQSTAQTGEKQTSSFDVKAFWEYHRVATERAQEVIQRLKTNEPVPDIVKLENEKYECEVEAADPVASASLSLEPCERKDSLPDLMKPRLELAEIISLLCDDFMVDHTLDDAIAVLSHVVSELERRRHQ